MIREDYFATPVYQFDLKSDNQPLIDWAYKVNEQPLNSNGGKQSFNTADKKNDASMQHTFPLPFQYLQNQIQDYINEVSNDLNFPKCELQNYWLNVNPYGGSNDVHNHPNSLLVANYYINATTDNMGDIVIHRQDDSQYYTSAIPNKTNITQRSIHIKPYTGLLVVFPGWVKHSVTTNLNEENDRISLSMNYGRIRL